MTRVLASSSSQTPVRRGAQGSVTRLPSGSLRVKVYAGLHPVTGRLRYIGETIAAGSLAREQAEEACRRLLGQVHRSRCLHSHATVDDLLNRHLAMAHGSEHSRQSQTQMAAKHLCPFIGHLPLRSVTSERLEHLYAELLRCPEHCPPQPEAGHVCRPLHPAPVRKLHYVLSAAFRRAVRWDWIDHKSHPRRRATVTAASPAAATQPGRGGADPRRGVEAYGPGADCLVGHGYRCPPGRVVCAAVAAPGPHPGCVGDPGGDRAGQRGSVAPPPPPNSPAVSAASTPWAAGTTTRSSPPKRSMPTTAGSSATTTPSSTVSVRISSSYTPRSRTPTRCGATSRRH